MSEKFKVRDHDQAHYMTLTITGWVDVFTRKNHLHLIARAGGEITLPEIIRDLKKHTAKTILRNMTDQPESRREWMLNLFAARADELKRVSNHKLWQDGFCPMELHGNRFIKQKIEYVHNNLVADYLVESPEHWMFGSARNYAGLNGLLDVIALKESGYDGT